MARTRGTIVYPLAPEAYDVPTSDDYALGINPNTGETYLIHSEGVSYPVTHNKPWRFNDYSIISRWHTLKEVREFPVRDGVDLADWVRSFGARLETNFRLAQTLLTREDPRKDTYEEGDEAVYRMLEGVGPK